MLKVCFRILPEEVLKTRERNPKAKGKTWVLVGSLANADTQTKAVIAHTYIKRVSNDEMNTFYS